MKKIASIFVSAILLFNIFIGLPSNQLVISAETVIDATTGIEFDSITGEITDYTGNSKNLIIPEIINVVRVTSIGKGAFNSCISLTNITIPNSVISIGDDAFNNCSSLTNISIPSSVTSINKNFFFGCSLLETINVDINNQYYTSENGVLFNKNETRLLAYPKHISSSYTIPNSVTSIGDYAFSNCSSLTNITITIIYYVNKSTICITT